MDLFVYGTLLFPEVLSALLDRVPPRTPATAPGWRVAALPGRLYPGLVPDGAALAGGQLVAGLTAAENELLDAYETAAYRRSVITLADGTSCPTYVWLGEVEPHDWDRNGFAADHLAGYVERVAGWRAGWQAGRRAGRRTGAGWPPPPAPDR